MLAKSAKQSRVQAVPSWRDAADRALQDPQQPAETQARSILGIAGSLRRDSCNRRLLQAACRLLPPYADLSVYERLREIPPFDEDDEHAPAAVVRELRERIQRADAVLIATPEYNGSLPGQLKNALDWVSRPYESNVLRGKPVAVVGASPSPGGTAHANADARRILTRIGAQVTDRTVLIPRAFAHLGPDGTLADPDFARQVSDLLSELMATARADIAA